MNFGRGEVVEWLQCMSDRGFRYNGQTQSIEHLQRIRHTNRGRLLLRTPGPVPLWDLHAF